MEAQGVARPIGTGIAAVFRMNIFADENLECMLVSQVFLAASVRPEWPS